MSKDIVAFIVRTPGTVGGRPRINGTRMPVQVIVGWYKKGYSAEEIAEQYDHMTLAQIYAALTYYHANQQEIDADITAEEALYDKLIQEYYETDYAKSDRIS